MAHGDVYKCFKLYFPQFADGNAEMWFPNGKDSIRVRMKDKREVIFTCGGKDNWKLETMKSFINGRKGEKVMK